MAWHYSKRTKHRYVASTPCCSIKLELPWMLANIDREVIGTDEVQILECKTAGIKGTPLKKASPNMCSCR